jgi:hypothetical protein
MEEKPATGKKNSIVNTIDPLKQFFVPHTDEPKGLRYMHTCIQPLYTTQKLSSLHYVVN